MSTTYDPKRIAQAEGRLDLAHAPEGFDALVMADVARARKSLCAFIARDDIMRPPVVDRPRHACFLAA